MRYLLTLMLVVLGLVACNKDDVENPVGNEAINFVEPDSTTIFASAGELVDFTLYLAIDQAIDTIRAGYYIDTAMSIDNLTLSDMDSIFFVQGFNDSSNVQTVSSVFTMPLGRNDTTPFRQYFSGSTNPFIPSQYDAVRVVFSLESDTLRYEKQLKIIVN